jgi:hypothetical protein
MSKLDSFNAAFVDLNLISGYGRMAGDEETTSYTKPADLNQTTDNNNPNINVELYDESTKNNKFNSFPMRLKKQSDGGAAGSNSTPNPKLKPAPRSASSIQQPPGSRSATNANTLHNDTQFISLTQNELELTVRMTRTRRQEADRLKHLIRNNCWPANHPIRKYLWTCLLESSSNGNSASNKENNRGGGGGGGGSNAHQNAHASSEIEYNKHLNQIFGKCKSLNFLSFCF